MESKSSKVEIEPTVNPWAYQVVAVRSLLVPESGSDPVGPKFPNTTCEARAEPATRHRLRPAAARERRRKLIAERYLEDTKNFNSRKRDITVFYSHSSLLAEQQVSRGDQLFSGGPQDKSGRASPSCDGPRVCCVYRGRFYQCPDLRRDKLHSSLVTTARLRRAVRSCGRTARCDRDRS
jgi:hypothetical protein